MEHKEGREVKVAVSRGFLWASPVASPVESPVCCRKEGPGGPIQFTPSGPVVIDCVATQYGNYQMKLVGDRIRASGTSNTWDADPIEMRLNFF